MVALLLLQPALGLEFVRVGKHSRIPRCCKVAEGDQRLHGDRAANVQRAHSARRTGARSPPRTHVFRDEVASDLNVSLCDHSGVGGNDRVESEKTGGQPFKRGKRKEKEGVFRCDGKASASYLRTSLIVAFSRGIWATSAAAGTLRPPSTLSTSSRSEACTAWWRASSYNDQDRVLEI